MLSGKNIVLGVSGGIAVYKACDIVSRLKKLNANVKVIMTKSATEFVTPLTFQSLSQNFVITDMFKEPKTWDVEHISLAQWADLFLIAPATANIIGKIANGIADDMLSTTVMATKAEVVIAPAMNTNMYENKIVQDNISKLIKFGYKFIEPESGRLACGDVGKGKLASPENIVKEIIEIFTDKKDLNEKNILITAGPTIESIDPVRYITNRSSGKMGYSIAAEAVKRGANVTLISGKTNLDIPVGVKKFIEVESADDMYNVVMENLENNDIIIKSAAVADYKPKYKQSKKIKKSDEDLCIELDRNYDILKEIGKMKKNKVLVGFAAETNDLIENAKKKIKNKNLDFIVANDLTQEGAGFGVDTNIVKIIDKNGNIEQYPKMSKSDIANIILDKIKLLLK
ncbi:bifunctional phosphopantothenoylcysteine decarboxylase/phosphopantothenate--cysteine ligase CoaBC [Tepidibacter thalassicus]|uniref:Coenzyme A biosynthesis bifunctional protein CoaBC n=1 Tax=Tepidibacter thalassicus DSM 15285 TaxID=1123350 RepID=A0A1M5Q795_9FIRM|nr:bifunctional phosphopantothenoylcysteine decarboxylase/phosphopantothenate--cysteine ligase CoaBC [Tepidibacter thalassicus]SHH09790.1 phosphopantothenoylcysteine decarboxylase / phosphopantothenate--cysteine ligase [Tepidibacter thalassicus DSM 15285]